jgi:thiamine monophosphate kinase
MIDLSDGLIQDLEHLLAASGCRARLVSEQLPVPPAVLSAQQMVVGGEDFELLFTAPASLRPQLEILSSNDSGRQLTRIGEILPRDAGNSASSSPIEILEMGEILAVEEWLAKAQVVSKGFDHFLS